MQRGLKLAVVLAASVLTATGCSGLNPGTDDAADAAGDFHAAVEAGDYAAACAMLTPPVRESVEDGEPGSCAQKLGDLELGAGGRVESSQAYGRNARVILAEDTVFLTRSGGHWLVMGAGCTSRGERPYDCEVEGN